RKCHGVPKDVSHPWVKTVTRPWSSLDPGMREFHAPCVEFTHAGMSEVSIQRTLGGKRRDNCLGLATSISPTSVLHVDLRGVRAGRYDGISWHAFCERKGSQNQKLRMK